MEGVSGMSKNMSNRLILLALLLTPVGMYAMYSINALDTMYAVSTMDVSYGPVKIDENGVIRVSCLIRVKGIPQKKIIVTLDDFGRVQETPFLVGKDGKELSRKVYKAYDDPHPLSQFGKKMLKDIKYYQQTFLNMSDVNENENENYEDSNLRPFPPEKTKGRFLGWFARKKKASY